jgi:hypothetical protein
MHKYRYLKIIPMHVMNFILHLEGIVLTKINT